MAVSGHGSSKLLLFGEHAAVYGYPALGVSLTEKTTVRLDPAKAEGWMSASPEASDAASVNRLLESFLEVIPELKRSSGGTVEIVSNIPRDLGFGSSAALCVALAAAFHELLAEKCREFPGGDGRKIWIWGRAHRAERFFHGTPSGIDTGLSLHPGLHALFPAPPDLPEIRRLRYEGLVIVYGAVPRISSTQALVGRLRQTMQQGDVSVKARIERLGVIAEQAIQLLEKPEKDGLVPGMLGERAQEAQELLRQLDLSTHQLELVLEEGAACGAIGGKLSGAGGGGAFLLFMPDEERANLTARRIKDLAKRERWNTGGTVGVVCTEKEDPEGVRG